jgi:hypothetical protein
MNMSAIGTTGSDIDVRTARPDQRRTEAMRQFTETKAFAKTSEFFVWALAVAATLIATYADNDDALHNDKGWLYVAILSAAYIVSRGLAKSGTREPYTQHREQH